MTQRTLYIIIAGIITAVIGISYAAYRVACRNLELAAEARLSAICQTRKKLIEHYFHELSEQIQALAKDPKTIAAMRDFKTAYIDLSKSAETMNLDAQKASLYLYYYDDYIRKLNFHLREAKTANDFFPVSPIGILLQAAYIADNPNPTGKKELLISAPEAKEYDVVHKKYHPFFYDTLSKFNYYDIFLIDSHNGTIYYTVQKEIDFANNLLKTNLHDSNLFYLISNMPKSDNPKIVDFQYYMGSYGVPAAFIGIPIVDQGNTLGILVFQIPINQINEIMTNNENPQDMGLGKTGETYLVGKDATMRSISRRFAEDKYSFLNNAQKMGVDPLTVSNMREFETTVLLQEVDTPPVHAALKGETGIMKTTGYEGEKVLSAYAPIKIQGLKWAIIAKQSISEICAPAKNLIMKIILSALVFILLLIAIIVLFKKYRRKYAK